MRAQIGKWGNSLALRIPSRLAREMAVGEGNSVEISVHAGRMTIVATQEEAYDLKSLLAGISDHHLHDEISTGEAVGHEAL